MVVTRTIATLRSKNIVIELRISKTLVEPDIEMIKANATLGHVPQSLNRYSEQQQFPQFPDVIS